MSEVKLKVVRSVVALCVSAVALLVAAPMCYGQCPLHVPSKCQQLVKEREDLIAQRKGLQADMKDAVGQEKSAIAGQIKSLSTRIDAKQQQINSCGAEYGVDNVSATLKGTLDMYTDRDAKAGMDYRIISKGTVPHADIHVQMTYLRWTHSQFVVNEVSDLNYHLHYPVTYSEYRLASSDPSSQFSSGCGSLDPKSGNLSVTLTIPVTVLGRLDTRWPNGFEDNMGYSNLLITLTNSGSGAWLDGKRKINLSGKGVFQDGMLKGQHCYLSFAGILLPLP